MMIAGYAVLAWASIATRMKHAAILFGGAVTAGRNGLRSAFIGRTGRDPMTKPHIRRWCGLWECRCDRFSRAAYGYTPLHAYTEWKRLREYA
jgi:sugar/nucleoside kinase (ribokinase family)